MHDTGETPLGRLAQHADLWAIGAIVLVGFAVRLHGVWAWWINPDEGIYYALATSSSWSRFWEEVGANAHPPLFYLIIRALGSLSLDLMVLRLPSLLSGALAILGVSLAARALGGRAAGVLAALLVAFSESAVVQSQLIRPYSMQLATLSFAVFGLARFVRTGHSRDLVTWGTLILVAVLLHYSSVLTALAGAGAVALLLAAGRLPARQGFRFYLSLIPATVTVAMLAILHVLPRLVGTELQASAREGWLQPFFSDGIASVGSSFLNLLRYWFGSSSYDVLPLIGLSVGFAVACARRQLLLAGLVGVSFAAAALLSFYAIYPFGPSRHSMYLLSVAIPCMAQGLSFLVVGRTWRHAVAVLALVWLVLYPEPIRRALGVTEIRHFGFAEQVVPRASVEKTAERLELALSAGDVLVMDQQTYFTLVPLLRPHELGKERNEAVGFSVFWLGDAQAVVSDRFVLGTGSRGIRAPDHVLGFLRRASRAEPGLRIAEGRGVHLLLGGWGARHYRRLHRLEAALSPGPACLVRFEVFEGAGWAQLNAVHCLERLSAGGR